MNTGMLEEKIMFMENQMWEAFATGDSTTFSKLVDTEAIMICGGYKETGYEYTKIVAQVRLDGYELSDFIVKVINQDTVLVNYIVSVKCPDQNLSGTFRVSSVWVDYGERWKLIFNQDSKM